MKRFTVILFAFAYLILSAGLIVHVHYCHGNLQGVEIFSANKVCCCGEVANKNNCCYDKSFYLKIDKEQYTNSIIKSLPEPSVQEMFRLSSLLDTNPFLTKKVVYSNTDRPPPKVDGPAWLLYCSFTYYG